MSNIINLNPEDPMASRLRDAVKAACDPSRPVIVSADAQGHIKHTPPPAQEVKLTPFESGALFAYSPNPRRPGTYFLHDAAGFNVALVVSEHIASVLCRGAHLFLDIAKAEIAEAKAKQPIDVESAVVAAEKVVETLEKPV